MKTLVVAEGKHERSGALETIVTRLATRELRLEFDRISRNDIHAHHGKGPGYFKRALRWLREAEKHGYGALILVIDEDGRHERTQQIDQAQENAHVSLPRALGVAIRTFDAWMLADEQALTRALGSVIQRQPDPESIADPKRVCAELVATSRNPTTQSEMYAAAAGEVNLERLESRCPRGFAPFAGRVRAL